MFGCRDPWTAKTVRILKIDMPEYMDRQIELFFFHGEIQATDQNDSLKTVEYDAKKVRIRENCQKIHINTPIPPLGG